MASKADLAIYQGDDFAAAVMVFNPDGTPANISGYSAQGHIRRGPADADADVDAVITCVVSSPSISLSIHHSITQTLLGQYVWDLQLIDGSGAVTTILAGKAKVTQEVTRIA